jgi:hypothetical protein
MFVTDGESNYDRVRDDLLAALHKRGTLVHADECLGATIRDGSFSVPLFGNPCDVTDDGVYQDARKLDTIGAILVLRYLLVGGSAPLEHAWTPYRDLKDGAQFAAFIKANIEDKLAAAFGGRSKRLAARLEGIGGRPYEGDVRADLTALLHPFPKVPVLCLFWDRDQEFPASLQFLFDRSAPSYLDLESLAVVLQYIYLKVLEEES